MQSRKCHLSRACKSFTALKMKFSIKDFFSKCDQIRKSSMEKFNFLCSVCKKINTFFEQRQVCATSFSCISPVKQNLLVDVSLEQPLREIISPYFLVWKFCGKVQLPYSSAYSVIVPFHKISKFGEITVFYAVSGLDFIRLFDNEVNNVANT